MYLKIALIATVIAVISAQRRYGRHEHYDEPHHQEPQLYQQKPHPYQHETHLHQQKPHPYQHETHLHQQKPHPYQHEPHLHQQKPHPYQHVPLLHQQKPHPYQHEPQSYQHEPRPYSFGYEIKDIHGEQTRHESRDDSGRVTGSYSFVDEKGIERIVQYIADHLGFRAKIITNEPGTANQNPAGVIMESRPGPSHAYTT